MARRDSWICLVMLLATAVGKAAAQAPIIDTLALRAHTYFLSHDRLRGRATGTAGAELAALYLASRCRALGLSSVGESYFQRVPLERALVLPSTLLSLRTGSDTIHFSYPKDFTPNVGSRATLVGFAGRAVYIGEPDRSTGSVVRDIDIAGRVAVTIGRTEGAVADTLAARGTAAILRLIGDSVRYRLYVQSRGNERLYHVDPEVRSSFLPRLPSILAGPELARSLLAGTPVVAGKPLEPQMLSPTVHFSIEVEREPVPAANVACLLPGSEPATRDTAIVFTAHYDHLGVGPSDASGDSIYNGFSDNAAGTAMLLAIAEAATRDGTNRPRHSLLFLFATGEERGLLGSDFYVARPLWPLDRTGAVINLDAGAPPAPPINWRLAGVDSTGLGEIAIQVAARRGWRVTTSAPRPNSDYYPFVREGVPAVSIIPGTGPYEGLTRDSSKVLRRRWDRYHQPGDEWATDFPFAGLARYAEYAYRIARALDGTPPTSDEQPRR